MARDKAISEILESLNEYKQTADYTSLRLRVSLSRLIIKHMKAKGWSQRDLSRQTGIKEPHISRILHGNANCTLETVGKILFAFGVAADIAEQVNSALDVSTTKDIVYLKNFTIKGKTDSYGKTIPQEKDSAYEAGYEAEYGQTTTIYAGSA